MLQKKKITLVHNQNLLLNPVYPDKYRKDIERRLRLRNVDLILGDALENPTEGVAGVTTKNGKSLPDADLVVRNNTFDYLLIMSLTPSWDASDPGIRREAEYRARQVARRRCAQ